ncbi:MAG: primosomal protein N' [Oscillospiraceae bacterium]|nr:primosomal protein N' [Oscillospiraceae bacterium]
MPQIEYAKIAVSAAVYSMDRPYSYSLPSHLAEGALPGVRVMVPFGKGNRKTEGIILKRWQGEPLDGIKSVFSLLDDQPVLREPMLNLALWMRERCFCTMYDAVKAMLPSGLYYSSRDIYHLCEGLSGTKALEMVSHAPVQREILDILAQNGGSATREQICRECSGGQPQAALSLLVEKHVLELSTDTSRNVNDKMEQIASLLVPLEDALSEVKKTSKAQIAILKLLDQVGSASVKEIQYFTGSAKKTVQTLANKGLIELFQREVYRRIPANDASRQPPPVLNEEQQAAFDGIAALMNQRKPACSLLYGVTGSGKTQVYISLIHHALAQGRTALVLVPEIALTPQLLRHFEAQFGSQVAILHSSLSVGARYDEWKRARDGKAQVVIGTRSAIFAPLNDVGLIVLDEEQEASYKSDHIPRYHARDIAKYRCNQSGAVLVLGSATPSVETAYHAREGIYQKFCLKKRFNEQTMPKVELVDMRQELRMGNNTSLSGALRRELSANLERGEQAVLFLNRRGTSRMAVCVECGETPECPNCSVKLTYHKDNGRMMCHYCGFSKPLFPKCEICGGELCFVDAGVQMIQEQLEQAFPGISIARMDADSVSATHNHEDILNRFEKEKISVLLGTQMVAKGLDFEHVTLVGALDADQGLYLDSYRAGERTFSLLTQVVGRAGRGSRTGRAIIQTFTPKNERITCAARQDYDAFFESEIHLRTIKQLPPIRDQYQLTLTGRSDFHTLESARRLRTALQAWQFSPEMAGDSFAIYGPAEAPVLRVMGRYRYRLTLVCKDSRRVRTMLSHLLTAFQKDSFNKGVHLSVDLNPME